MKQLHFCGQECFKHAKSEVALTMSEKLMEIHQNLTFLFELPFNIFICTGKPIRLGVSIYYNKTLPCKY